MHLKVCIVILAAAYIAYAGEQFLDILKENGEGADNLVSRIRRTSGDNREFVREYLKHVVYCYNETEMEFKATEYKDILAEMKSKCEPKIQNLTDTKEHHYCLFQCIFEAMNLTDGNGNIVEDPEQVKQIGKIYLFDDETVLQNIATKCPAWSKEAVKNVQEETICKPQPVYFWFCLFDMRNLYCPEALRINNEYCDELRKDLTKTYQQ